jgi:hypothetical protein
MRGCLGPRVGLGEMEKWKFYIYRDLNTDASDVQPVARRYTACATASLFGNVVELQILYHCKRLGEHFGGRGGGDKETLYGEFSLK